MTTTTLKNIIENDVKPVIVNFANSKMTLIRGKHFWNKVEFLDSPSTHTLATSTQSERKQACAPYVYSTCMDTIETIFRIRIFIFDIFFYNFDEMEKITDTNMAHEMKSNNL